jgi:beta-carotene 3-hydroxylase
MTLINLGTVLITVAAMEVVAATVHRRIMHGFGWRWHRSHHDQRAGLFEANDLYALVFAALSIALFVAGRLFPPLWWVGLGMVVYGILYAILHDALVHRRIPFPKSPRSGYLKRLVQAHRLHHSVREREGAVSFGFLYAPPVASLVEQLRSTRPRP